MDVTLILFSSIFSAAGQMASEAPLQIEVAHDNHSRSVNTDASVLASAMAVLEEHLNTAMVDQALALAHSFVVANNSTTRLCIIAIFIGIAMIFAHHWFSSRRDVVRLNELKVFTTWAKQQVQLSSR